MIHIKNPKYMHFLTNGSLHLRNQPLSQLQVFMRKRERVFKVSSPNTTPKLHRFIHKLPWVLKSLKGGHLKSPFSTTTTFQTVAHIKLKNSFVIHLDETNINFISPSSFSQIPLKRMLTVHPAIKKKKSI